MSGHQDDFIAAVPRAEAAAFIAKRRGRNIAMLVVLFGLSALFYAISMVKMGHPG